MTFFEKFIQGEEHRYLILNNQVIAVQKKLLQPTKTNPWQLHYTGLSRQAWRQDLVDESLKIAQIFELNWVAVDFMVDEQEKALVLEFNSSPGIVKIHQPDAGVKTNVAKLIWQAVQKRV